MLTHLRVALVRFATAALALVTLFGVLRAGASYVYCPAMQMVSDAPCCAGDVRGPHDEEARVAEVKRRDCCERHALAQLPVAGAITPPPPALTAPLLALVAPPPVVVLDEASAPARVRLEYEVRAGPVVRSRHRAERMVFLN